MKNTTTKQLQCTCIKVLT